MQVAGSACARCRSKVAFESEGTTCRNCNVVFHERCLTQHRICPLCGGGIAAMEAEARHTEEQKAMQLLAHGRAVVSIIIVYYALMILFVLYAVVKSRLDPIEIAQLVTAGACGMYGLRRLRRTGRTGFIVSSAIGAIVLGLFTLREIGAGRSPSAVVGGGLFLGQVALVAILLASPGVDAYSYSQMRDR
jgi:hypothetical protein